MVVVFLFFEVPFCYLLVCAGNRHSRARIDLCISRTSLSLPWRLGEQMRNNPEETQKKEYGNSDRQSEVMNDRNQEIINSEIQSSLNLTIENDITKPVRLISNC